MSMCEKCYGNEVVYRFWKNDKTKELDSDWLYCSKCYPDNWGYWKEHYEKGWEEIDINEFNRLNEKMGYLDLSC